MTYLTTVVFNKLVAVESKKCRIPFLLLWMLSAVVLSARTLTYTIAPVTNASEQMIALRVELEFTGDDDGITELPLPTQYAGTFHLYRCFSRMRCTGASSMMMRSDSTVATVVHAPGASLRLIYEVQHTGNRLVADGAAPFFPLTGSWGFHFIGATALVTPSTVDGYQVTVRWRDFPDDWLMMNSFGVAGEEQTWQSPDAGWLSSVFTGGPKWRFHRKMINGYPVDVVITGDDWQFSDSLLLEAVVRVIDCQDTYWLEKGRPGYRVFMIPLSNRHGGGQDFTGTALLNSLAVYADPQRVATVTDLTHFLHHEMIHHWIGGKIKNGGGANDMTLAWWSEGFTEYFAIQTQLACGFLDTSAYIAMIERDFVQALAESPVAEAGNDEIAQGFFADPDLRRLPYLRGCLFAREVDGLIIRHSKGKNNLRNVVLEVIRDYSRERITVDGHEEDMFRRFSEAAGRKVKL